MSIFGEGGNAERKRRAQLQIQIPARRLLERGIVAVNKKYGDHIAKAENKSAAAGDYDLAPMYLPRLRRSAQKIFADTRIHLPRPRTLNADPLLREIDRYIADNGLLLAGFIADSLKNKIQAALAQAAADGDSAAKTGRRIAALTAGAIAARRAQTIARTEVHSMMMHFAGTIAEREIGVQSKIWNAAAHQERTRPTHRAADGQRRAMDALFTIGGASARYPGDPRLPARERINCRCAMTFRMPQARE